MYHPLSRNEIVEVLTPDKTKTISRVPIARAGYWVVRYKGYYHHLRGGIRTPLWVSKYPYGKA